MPSHLKTQFAQEKVSATSSGSIKKADSPKKFLVPLESGVGAGFMGGISTHIAYKGLEMFHYALTVDEESKPGFMPPARFMGTIGSLFFLVGIVGMTVSAVGIEKAMNTTRKA